MVARLDGSRCIYAETHVKNGVWLRGMVKAGRDGGRGRNPGGVLLGEELGAGLMLTFRFNL